MIKGIFIIIMVLLFLTGFSTAAENACVGCHTSVGATKGIINDWKESKHALKNVTCDKCHSAQVSQFGAGRDTHRHEVLLGCNLEFQRHN